jgi:predicted protein tyrosine phosphatase
MNVLFVCSQARIRSLTASHLCNLGGVQSSYCGTDRDALISLSVNEIQNASEIICLERHHIPYVKKIADAASICSLGIPDDYDPFDDELVALLIGSLRHKIPIVSEAIERGWSIYKKGQ